ncbi:ABC transporter substrate-binding protein [Actinomyces lilanjuaniae]|uniref:ABC transporter substrate-binding protein n=1 Tax=Actinomyces lilanjuaniae TaxID=2321394 RepID=A0ABM6Z5H8_9ACTO|nr:ABC transporter substrate-binding protein [Actinomyces lilanjuaniae]AYD90376.1 ABC transporter substrate-binding protein [Actinomyces lilanjuaniae]
MNTSAPVPTRRQAIAVLGIGAGAVLVAGCGGGPPEATDGRVRLAMFNTPRASMSPFSDDAFMLTKWSCAETLVNLDAEGKLVEALASSWERTNGTTWRFTVREGVTFHDGSALTAEQAAACIDFAASHPEAPRILDDVELSVTAEGSEVVVTTAEPDPLLPQRLSSPSMVILAEGAYPDASDGVIDPIGYGTGPFRLTEVNGTATATLERYEDYWGEAATASGIDVSFVPDGTARGSALRTGEADVVEAVPFSQVANLDESLLHEIVTPRTLTLYLNTAEGVFTDKGLRAAVRDAIEPTELTATVYEGYADVAPGLFGPALTWAEELRSWGTTSFTGAKGAGAAGRVPGAAKASKVPEGTTITIGTYSDRPELEEVLVVVTEQLEKAGFTVKNDVREYEQIESDALAGAFDAFLLSRGTVLDSGDPVAYMESDFSSDGSFSLCFLKDTKVDAALDKAAALEAGQERRKAIIAAEEAILATGAAVPLVNERLLQGEAAGLTGAERDPYTRALITASTAVGQ